MVCAQEGEGVAVGEDKEGEGADGFDAEVWGEEEVVDLEAEFEGEGEEGGGVVGGYGLLGMVGLDRELGGHWGGLWWVKGFCESIKLVEVKWCGRLGWFAFGCRMVEAEGSGTDVKQAYISHN